MPRDLRERQTVLAHLEAPAGVDWSALSPAPEPRTEQRGAVVLLVAIATCAAVVVGIALILASRWAWALLQGLAR